MRQSPQADLLVVDIGSTITKLSGFSGLNGSGGSTGPHFLGQGTSRTTVDEGDVALGLELARRNLENQLGHPTDKVPLMASSSAAGGLRMTVHGLTYDMTLRAGREASLGAGAIITYATAGRIQEEDIEEIRRIRPNLILLTGGVDYGDRETVLANAEALSELGFAVPVIYAGNKAVRSGVQRKLEQASLPVFVVDNVYPRIDELNVVPVRRVIQDVFAKHIITAPGMNAIKEMIEGEIIPTPGAVLRSVELLAEKLGDVLAVDVGGATTDVHSVTEGSAKFAKMMVAPEPRAKRTVEGDLGIYVNAMRVVEAAGDSLRHITKVEPIPGSEDERRASTELAKWAVDISIWRHAGELRVLYGAYGKNEIVEGRDLTAVNCIIGTGGALVRLGMGKEILTELRKDPKKRKLLPPPEASILLDRDYIMSAAGVISQQYPVEAKKLLLESVQWNAA